MRTIQRISATNLESREADLLEVKERAAGRRIERIFYLPIGRVVEFAQSIYRGEAYDFLAELQVTA